MVSEKMLPISAVIETTGLSRSMIYAMIARSEFPPGVRMTERRVAWPASEVQAYIGSRIAAARGERRHAPIVQTLETAAQGQQDDAHDRASARPLNDEGESSLRPTIDIDRLLGRKPG